MLVHSVYFWLKKDVTDEQRAFFKTCLDRLKNVEEAVAVYTGSPSTTNRPVIERSYDFALTLVFKDMPAHDAYQVSPPHKQFLKDCSAMFDRLVIYDAD
ncbi:MAG: Dabb family protein [Phycisphaerae bacterium]|jgi:hypothetical protein